MFSIIIPVYNRENYLQKCIDSLVNQTFKDIEIILVDDCSTDNSLEIIKENMKRDRRIKLVRHEVNKKSHQSRRSGFLVSTHKYILFVDSDDYLALDACEKLYNILSKKHYDIIQFQGVSVFDNYERYENRYDFGKIFNSKEYFDNKVFEELFVNLKKIVWYVWGKCLHRDLVGKSFSHIGDTCIYWYEDFIQYFIVAYYAKSIIFDDNIVYYYVQHDSSSFSKIGVDRYLNEFFPNYVRVSNLIQSFIDKEGIYKKYPVIKNYIYFNDCVKGRGSSIFNVYLKVDRSLLPIMFGLFANHKKLILYIFFVKLTIKMTEEKIDKLALCIPVVKWRDGFKAKFI